MNNIFKLALNSTLLLLLSMAGCKKEEYSFGALKSPTNLVLTTTIAGATTALPTGNGSGNVVITATANDAITYKVDFGDGRTQVVPSGSINYRYTTPGTAEYTITVNAIGTGGAISTISKKVKVFVDFVIPADIVQFLTNGSSKVWVTDRAAVGHVGVGPADGFTPSYYAATPDSREPCQYDDEITFSKDATGGITMNIANKGQTYVIGAATGKYGFAGGDGCYSVDVAGTKKLAFMDATSASNSSNSTRIQFTVPGSGVINFATGSNTYEILSINANSLHLRNIGIDGNAWYQKLTVKP